jgi:DNA-binding response OmpR family regulator
MKTILVVEDKVSLGNAMTKKFELNDFEVFQVDNFSDALEALKNNPIDAVCLDHQLIGEKSGLDLVTEMKKEDNDWKKIPVFVLSNTATPENIHAYTQLGVDKYYTKSNVSLESIVEDVKNALAKQ